MYVYIYIYIYISHISSYHATSCPGSRRTQLLFGSVAQLGQPPLMLIIIILLLTLMLMLILRRILYTIDHILYTIVAHEGRRPVGPAAAESDLEHGPERLPGVTFGTGMINLLYFIMLLCLFAMFCWFYFSPQGRSDQRKVHIDYTYSTHKVHIRVISNMVQSASQASPSVTLAIPRSMHL